MTEGDRRIWRYKVDNIVSSKLEEAFELIEAEKFDPILVHDHLSRQWKIGADWDDWFQHR